MRTFLLAWNPKKWSEENFSEYVEEFQRQGSASGSWSVGQRRDLPTGSRVFLVRVGSHPKGLIASGWATSEPSEGPHWDETEAKTGKTRWGISVEFDHLQSFPVLTLAELACPPFDQTGWLIQGSGVELPPHIAAALEARWIIAKNVVAGQLPEELSEPTQWLEGAKTRITINAYERNPAARKSCIEFHGSECSVCGMSFRDAYGADFEGFIHVHHLSPVSSKGGNYKVNPESDLCPVCPNCHAVMHLRNPPYTVEEVKNFRSKAPGRRDS